MTTNSKGDIYHYDVSFSKVKMLKRLTYSQCRYVAVYPMALSVRSSNVYEERSLGIMGDEESTYAQPDHDGAGSKWGAYLAWHARKQLAFGLCFSLLVSIISW